MNYILAFLVVLVLSIGNFFPFLEIDFFMFLIKAFLLCVAILYLLLTNKSAFVDKRAFYYFLIVTSLFCCIVFRSYDLVYALDKYLSITLVVLFAYYFFKELCRRNGVNKAIEYVVLCGLFILGLTLVYKLIFGFWVREVRFFLNGSIVFGWMMAMYSLLSLYLYKNIRKKIYFLLTIAFFMAILWAESKGPILGYILAVTFYLAYDSKIVIKLFLGFVSLLIFIFGNNILDFLEKYLADMRLSALLRIIKGDVSSQDAGSITIRQDMLIEAYNLFYNNIISGVGLGNYQYHTVYGFIYPHNIHLEIFMECGILIGLVYVLFLFFSFYKASSIIKSLIVLFVVCGCFSGDITYLRFLIFICLIGLFLNKFNDYDVRVTS